MISIRFSLACSAGTPRLMGAQLLTTSLAAFSCEIALVYDAYFSAKLEGLAQSPRSAQAVISETLA